MNSRSKVQFSFALLHPRYWLTWLSFGLWWLVSQLPYPVLLMLGRGLGWVTYHLLKRRRFITRRNLELCFPEKSADEREALVRENFVSTATAVFESGIAWFWPVSRLKKLYTIEGIEIIQDQLRKGQGMILLTLHFTTLEIMGAAMTSLMDSMAVSYRPHRNPVYDLIQARSRARRNPTAAAIAAGDVRSMVRHLRRGYGIGYLPDQDFGPKHSVFAPFFGIPAATVVGLPRLARMADVPVIPLVNLRRPDGKGYIFRVLPPFEDFPSGDETADALKLNEHVERCIRECPEQYLWMHRRFKSRPPGEPDLYGLPKRSRRRRHRHRGA
ncbi:LpxL/LpxP family Kdo(2)-lipid IV(A) lauroyl/palmitoleoyl acyltransferase [Gilvimarinus sp. F26214L]|uniref:LpxL/LpxP family Kdo(2)-lipid IV(A) lauroyl/palmitoleoyl acyltransferase n=1 Tax=Gilvimarinus sp. DZF01 TaxID=3461371 RepID=UPI0040463590